MAAPGGAIRAGRAFVELFADSSKLTAGLNAASAKMKAWGAVVTGIGTKVFGAGAVLTGGFLAAAKVFDNFGSGLIDLSAQTGASVEALAELGFAAAQSGSSIEDVGTFIGKMQVSLTNASEGSKEARKAFDDLGLSVADLMAMSPEDQFAAIAAAISKIENVAKRVDLQKAIGGKGGAKLSGMMADLPALRRSGRESGAVMTREQAELADKFGDSLGALKFAFRAIVAEIGGAAAPHLTKFAETLTASLGKVRQWIQDNRGLISSLFQLSVGALAVGAAITVLGGVLTTAGTALGIISGLITAILSPVGLLTVAVGGLVTAWATMTQEGESAWGNIKSVALDAWGGIVDAVMSGDLELAGRIAWAALKIVWLEGVEGVKATWQKFIDWLESKHVFEFLDGIAEGWGWVTLAIGEAWDMLKKFDATLDKIGSNRALRAALGPLGLFLGDDGKPAGSGGAIPGPAPGIKTVAERLAEERAALARANQGPTLGELGTPAQRELAEAKADLRRALGVARDGRALAGLKLFGPTLAELGAAKGAGGGIPGSGLSAGTFNPFAAQALGGTGGPAVQAVKLAQKAEKQREQQLGELVDIADKLDNLGVEFA